MATRHGIEGPSRRPAPMARLRLDPEQVAIEALGFLAADPTRLDRFFALTGLDPAGLRAAARSPGFTRAVLAHLGSDETVLVAFAEAGGYHPEAVGALVRAVAEGGDGAPVG